MNFIQENLTELGLNKEQIYKISTKLLECREKYLDPKKQIEIDPPSTDLTKSEKGRYLYNQIYEKVFATEIQPTLLELIDMSQKENSEIENIISDVFGLTQDLVQTYAKSASTTIKIPTDLTNNHTIFNPFLGGAMKEIVIEKTLNSDGTYNTNYKSVSSDLVTTYDAKGNVLTTSGKGNLDNLAKALWNRGYNATYVEQHWFDRCINGSTPEQTVQKWVIRSVTSEGALEICNALTEIKKENEKEALAEIDAEIEKIDATERTTTTPQSHNDLDIMLDDLAQKIRNGEKPDYSVDLHSIFKENAKAIGIDRARDFWAKELQERPELFVYLPTEAFEKDAAKELHTVAKTALYENISAISAKDITPKIVDSVSKTLQAFDNKINYEKQNIAEIERQDQQKNDLLDKITNNGKDKF